MAKSVSEIDSLKAVLKSLKAKLTEEVYPDKQKSLKREIETIAAKIRLRKP